MSDSPIGGGAAGRLESALVDAVRGQRLPGAAAGIVHGDELVWWHGAGFADIAGRRVPDAATLYRIASITKTFTATAIMQLRDEGRLDLDDPAVRHVPELAAADATAGPIEAVTIRRLLSHESGLLGDPPGTDWSSGTYEGDPERTLQRVAEIGLRVPPNTQQKYSNLGYQLLGEIVTRLSGMPVGDVIRKRLLQPLGMSSTNFEPAADADRAVGYAPRAFSDDLRPSIETAISVAEGGLWSCVADLAAWISFQFTEEGDDRGRDRIVRPATLREMHRPRYLGNDEWTEAWGIGWYAVRRDGVSWVQHSGGLHGFASNVCFDPKERVGGIVLINGDGHADLAMDLAAIAREAVRAAPRPVEAPEPLPEAYAELLGLYTDPEWTDVLRLEWRDGALIWVLQEEPEWRPTLRPTADPDAFTVEPGVRQSGEPCIFRRRDDGTVTGAKLGPMELRRLAPVEGGG